MINLDHLKFVGKGLHRPECVLVGADGTLHVADWRGGVTVISKDGKQRTVLAKGEFRPKPNGLAILEDGGWLLTHLGDEDGGVYKLSQDGELSPFLLEINGDPLPPTNYVHVDRNGRTWITVSTRLNPRILGCQPDCCDGFIILVGENGARIVADELGFTNECLVHPETGHLYVNETFARRLSRYDVALNGDLSNKTTIAEFGFGEFPDGLTFDAEGGIWITSIVSNRIIRVAPNGKQELIMEDSDPDHLVWVEDAYQEGCLRREHLDKAVSRKLMNISSLAFGGEDLKTVYLGCLLGESIATFHSEIAGLRPYHWNSIESKSFS